MKQLLRPLPTPLDQQSCCVRLRTPGFASALHLRCSYSAPQLHSAMPLRAVGVGGSRRSPQHFITEASRAVPATPSRWLRSKQTQSAGTKGQSLLSLPPIPGRGEKQKTYPISCLWHVEARTLFYNDLIITDQMMAADNAAPSGGAPSVGSLSAPAALPGQGEGSPSGLLSGSLAGVSRGTAWGHSRATGSTAV